MNGIPPAQSTDAEDVVWALETAEALWKRNERGDAIVWLRRAAQAAGEANDDDRAFALAREAAELAEWVAAGPPAGASLRPEPTQSSVGGMEIDSLLQSSQVDPSDVLSIPPSRAPGPVEVTPTSGRAHRPPPLPVESTLFPSVSAVLSVDAEAPPRTPPPSPPPVPLAGALPVSPGRGPYPSERVPSAAESHAGMLDPWSDVDRLSDVGVPLRAPPRQGTSPLATRPVPEKEAISPAAIAFEDEVVTSISLAATRPANPVAPPLTKALDPAPSPPKAPHRSAGEARPTRAKLVRSRPPFPLPRAPSSEPGPIAKPFPAPERPHSRPPDPIAKPAANAETVPSPPITERELPDFPSQAGPAPLPPLDLTLVEAFSDLPDDSRDQLARGSLVKQYEKGETIESFALAFVVSGEVDVHAAGARSRATTIATGTVLRSRGTLDEAIPLRLVCASPTAVVASWDATAVDAALGSCPWVEEDLRSVGDRVQALAGASLGALGQRLSPDLWAGIVDKLTMRALAGGEVIVTEGVPVPGILLVAAGHVELEANDVEASRVSLGQFVLPNEALSAGPSPVTARAAAGGALVFAADRKTTQELFATEPLLIELLAGG